MTKKTNRDLCRQYGLRTGDLLSCGGDRYVFDDFGGVDDGNPWVVAYKVLDGGKMESRANRLCVWRRVVGGRVGDLEPQCMIDAGASCYAMKGARCAG